MKLERGDHMNKDKIEGKIKDLNSMRAVQKKYLKINSAEFLSGWSI